MDFEDNVEAPGMRVLNQGLPARREPAAVGERLDEEHGPRPTRRRRGNLPRVHDDIFHEDREARGRGSPQEIEVAPEDPRLREDGQRERICRRNPGQEEIELRGVSDERDRRRSKLDLGNYVGAAGRGAENTGERGTSGSRGPDIIVAFVEKTFRIPDETFQLIHGHRPPNDRRSSPSQGSARSRTLSRSPRLPSRGASLRGARKLSRRPESRRPHCQGAYPASVRVLLARSATPRSPHSP